MQKAKISKRVGRQLYRSSPTILTVVASVGVIVTTITAVRATPKAVKLLKEAELVMVLYLMRSPLGLFFFAQKLQTVL